MIIRKQIRMYNEYSRRKLAGFELLIVPKKLDLYLVRDRKVVVENVDSEREGGVEVINSMKMYLKKEEFPSRH